MAKRRQRRKREKEQQHAPKPVRALELDVARLAEPVPRLVYSREQAAQALGISLATLDRRVVPTIATVKTEWGSRLIPAAELDRYLAERRDQPRARSRRRTIRLDRRSALAPEVVDRIRHEHARGATLAEIARGLNRDGIPTGQGGRQWWSSTVRAIVLRTAPPA